MGLLLGAEQAPGDVPAIDHPQGHEPEPPPVEGAVGMECVEARIHRVRDGEQLALMPLGVVNRRHVPRGLLRA